MPSRNSTFAIHTEGFGGVMLRRLDVTDGLPTIVAAARFAPKMLCGGCDAPGEAIIVGVDGFESQASNDYSWRIPAGRYRVYLLTDGTPVRVRINIPNGRGKRVLHAGQGVDNPVPDAIPLLTGVAGAPFSAFGRGDRLGSAGAILWGGLVYTESDGDVEIVGCSHTGAEANPAWFSPGCPTGTLEGSYGFTHALTEGTVIHGAGFIRERLAGDWSVGGNVVVAGDVAALGWARVVLPFAGNGTVVPPPTEAQAGPPSLPGAAPSDAAPPRPARTGRPPRIRLLTRSARVRRGRAALRVGCSGEGTCNAALRIGRARASRISLRAGRDTVVRVAVPAAAVTRVRRRGRASVVVDLGVERARLRLRC